MRSTLSRPTPPANSTTAPLVRDASDSVSVCQFRSTDDVSRLPKFVARTGLAQLHCSGSAQFSALGWLQIRSSIGVADAQLFVVDVREESHGFINGHAVSWRAEHNWGCAGLSHEEALALERIRLHALASAEHVDVTVGQEVSDRTVAVPITELQPTGALRPGETCAAAQGDAPCPRKHYLQHAVKPAVDTPRVERIERWARREVVSEAELIALPEGHYVRIPVTDHLAPSAEQLARFVAFTRTLAADSHVHIHCRGGHGRTTLLMTLFDILRNAGNVAFDDLVLRNRLLSEYCLCLIQSDYRQPYQLDRLEVMAELYAEQLRWPEHVATG